MEQIIHAFGIDGRLILIQIINFGILMAALGYFLYNPILNVLKSREEKIAEGVADAEAAALARINAEAEKQDILTKAHEEAHAVVLRATDAAVAESGVLIKDAEHKAAAALAEAAVKAKQLTDEATRQAEAEIAKTALLAAEKILREQATTT